MTTLTKSSIIPSARTVIAKVAARHSVAPEEIVSEKRREAVAHARQMACWLLRLQGWHYQDIASYFEQEHGTIMHACFAINNRMDVDKKWRKLWPEYIRFRVAGQAYEPIGEELDRW